MIDNLIHKKASVAAGALLLIASISSLAQEQRPALVPLSTGSGSAGSTNSSSGIGELTDQPIGPGAVVHISVFNAPDFSGTSRVSESGDVAVPVVGAVHIEGLNSQKASDLINSQFVNSQFSSEGKGQIDTSARIRIEN